MDAPVILDSLNVAQRTAVVAAKRNILVLAGAGSGKTRVLVHRIAWYIAHEQVLPSAIMAVTFTNRAATEMRTRIEGLLGSSAGGMWVGTFHGLAHRLLRIHFQECNLPKSFQVLDSGDQQRLIRRVLSLLELDKTLLSTRELQQFINDCKGQGLRPRAFADDQGDPRMQQIYAAYQELCDRSGLVDFAELLLRSYELLQVNSNILGHYQQRFRHILVDEFQDTSALQYNWLRLLVGSASTLFAVGDDDQSVYSWRGACVGNMQQFQRDFEAAQLFRLEQNYRSTSTILKAANALIANNKGRLGKKLWTNGEEGARIDLYTADDERDEARYVVGQIIAAGSYRDYAILYRVGAQSRAFEEELIRAGIPYRIYGGIRFYERAEIKDALAYVRLAYYHHDDTAFERIVNTPARAIGKQTLEKIRTLARARSCSLWDAAVQAIADSLLATRACRALAGFLQLLTGLAREQVGAASLGEYIEQVIEHSGLLRHFQREKDEHSLNRIENLKELITAANSFTVDAAAADAADELVAFLAHAALESGELHAYDSDDFVQLMTLHAAKGLEFSQLFLVGMEEQLFPHQLSIGDPMQMQEERRLCYVGITRAKKKLTISHARYRRLYGGGYNPFPSRFIGEIPHALLHAIGSDLDRWTDRQQPAVGQLTPAIESLSPVMDQTAPALAALSLGQRVRHKRFGEGVVLNLEGSAEHARAQVHFEQAGCKWLVLAYAHLQPVTVK